MRKIIFMTICLFATQSLVYAQNPSDYLILQDIGIYKLFTGISGRVFSGPPSKYSQTNTGGVLSSSDHLSENDVSYEVSYTEPASKWPFVKVEVTQHTGGDSDRWLLHEVETSFRDSDKLEVGPDEDSMIRTINNNKIFFYGGGVVGYRWMNNNVVVNIQYTNLSGPKPEPLEVVQAYLAKFPSTVTMTDSELKANAHNTQWIKDEMDRRLWLCDKWNAQFQAGKTTEKDLLYNLFRSIKVFLLYRDKYYGVSAADELAAIGNYNRSNDLTSIQTKLTEYKTWWNANKGKSISLP